ncbi:MAG TPA: ABC transporter transmembrane domain-containing protein, partial [Polyangia bacterium]|nr:ABC transporter transmembrane domain-containing protein [Polyangia bacterium]
MERGRSARGPAGAGKAVLRALRYLRGYKVETFGALLALLLVSAANLMAPQMVRLAIDRGIRDRSWNMVVFAVIGLIAIAIGRGLFNFAQGYLAERASQGVAFDLRDGLFNHIQKLSFSYYDQAQPGQLLTRLTNDVEQVRTFVGAG